MSTYQYGVEESMNRKTKESKGEIQQMQNKVSVREEPANIVFKRAAVTNITNYEYCFDNNLKSKPIKPVDSKCL